MTEFKNGDRVRAVRDTSTLGGRPIKEGEQFVVLSTPDDITLSVAPPSGRWPALTGFRSDSPAGGRSVSAEDFEHANAPVVDDLWDAKDRLQREVAAEVFTAPAPLDPSKVKPGDTVTLEKGTAKHVDLVADVDRYQDGDYRFKSTTSPTHVYRVGDGAWTLTAHQPAPEPEPEWTDGTVAEVTYNNADETEQFKTRALRGDGSWVPFADVSDLIMDDEVTDVRPLVVIDPAAARKSLEDNGWGAHETADILEHLGLNR